MHLDLFSLFLHAFAAYAFAFIAFYLFYHQYLAYTQLRHQHLSQLHHNDMGLTCFIDHIPKKIIKSNQTDDELYEFFNKLYPNQIKNAVILKDTRGLAQKIKERDEIVHQLEHAYAWMEEHSKDRPTMRPSFFLCHSVDTITYLTNKLDECNRHINSIHQGIISNGHISNTYHSISTGFITFYSSYLASTIPCIQHNKKPREYRIRHAPEPDDLDWQTLNQPIHTRWIRNIWMQLVFILIIVTWSIPVMIAQSFGNLRNLAGELRIRIAECEKMVIKE